jgi:hypothetical protein
MQLWLFGYKPGTLTVYNETHVLPIALIKLPYESFIRRLNLRVVADYVQLKFDKFMQWAAYIQNRILIIEINFNLPEWSLQEKYRTGYLIIAK